MYPIMVKIPFAEVIKVAKTPKPVLLTLFINWAVKPFTMFFFATLFLGFLFRRFISGTELPANGQTVALYRSYIAGCILLGIAPCTAMVLMWSYLAKSNDALTLVMVAVNSLTILWIAIPLLIQTVFIFSLGYFVLARLLKLSYHDAAPSAMVGASNHFEVAIATSTMLFGLSSGAALATVVGVLIEVPLMLALVSVCKRYCYLFKGCRPALPRSEYIL